MSFISQPWAETLTGSSDAGPGDRAVVRGGTAEPGNSSVLKDFLFILQYETSIFSLRAGRGNERERMR